MFHINRTYICTPYHGGMVHLIGTHIHHTYMEMITREGCVHLGRQVYSTKCDRPYCSSLTYIPPTLTHWSLSPPSLTGPSPLPHSLVPLPSLTHQSLFPPSLTGPSPFLHSPAPHPSLTHWSLSPPSLTGPSPLPHSPVPHPSLTHWSLSPPSLTVPLPSLTHRSLSPPSPPINFSARSSFLAQVSTCCSSSSFFSVISWNCCCREASLSSTWTRRGKGEGEGGRGGSERDRGDRGCVAYRRRQTQGSP